MALKTLRVCLSTELPTISDRDPNFIYFVYDKLVLFNGQNMYYDDFAIIEEMPEEAVEYLWYICLDGYIRIKADYSIIEIAQIENEDQLEFLRKAGSLFFYKSNKRYFDTRRQLLELPYMNGSYIMSIHLANNIILDKDTAIVFNPETSEFEIAGRKHDYDEYPEENIEVDLPVIKKVESSNTVDLKIENGTIKSNIKISPSDGNIIRIGKNGIYASVEDRVTQDAFRQYITKYNQYKDELANVIHNLDIQIQSAQDIVSVESVTNRIRESLAETYDEIEYALSQFDEWAPKFQGIESRCLARINQNFEQFNAEMKEEMNNYLNHPWSELDYDPNEELERLRLNIATLNNQVRIASYDLKDLEKEIDYIYFLISPMGQIFTKMKKNTIALMQSVNTQDVAFSAFELMVNIYEPNLSESWI